MSGRCTLTQLIDELWAPTQFVAQAMRGTMSLPVYDMPPGILLGKTVPIARETSVFPPDHFVFLFVFDMCSDFNARIRSRLSARFAWHSRQMNLLRSRSNCAEGISIP